MLPIEAFRSAGFYSFLVVSRSLTAWRAVRRYDSVVGRRGKAMKPPSLTTSSAYQAEWWQRQGIVYFFSAGDPPSAVKIGMTTIRSGSSIVQAVRQRFKAIQTANHEVIHLLGVMIFTEGEFPTRDAEVLERELHIKYRNHGRFLEHTVGAEWFSPASDLLAFIEENAIQPALLGLPQTIAKLAGVQP
ncbi:UNVERIFIED_ORG: hypothetical protein GGD51_002450 [Rhizobium esperanzae]